MTEQSFSQHKQDILLDNDIFGKKNNGVFVEVGAFDGITFSNSFFFEKYRNWTGLCIEPITKRFEQLLTNRTCACENVAISVKEGELEFTWAEGDFETEMLSGVAHDAMNNERISKNIQSEKHNLQLIKVRVVPAQQLFDKHKLKQIDYCSIDVEGHEIEVLKSIDFKKTEIHVFSIEMNHSFGQCELHMMQNGYVFVRTIGPDAIFKKANNRLTPYFTIGIKRIIKKIIRVFSPSRFTYLRKK